MGGYGGTFVLRWFIVVGSFAGLLLTLGLWIGNALWGSYGLSSSSLSWGIDIEEGHIRLLQSVELESIPAQTIQTVELSIPFVAAAFVFGGLAVTFLLLIPRYRRYRCKKRGVCVHCGYDLRGSSTHCPECGSRIYR